MLSEEIKSRLFRAATNGLVTSISYFIELLRYIDYPPIDFSPYELGELVSISYTNTKDKHGVRLPVVYSVDNKDEQVRVIYMTPFDSELLGVVVGKWEEENSVGVTVYKNLAVLTAEGVVVVRDYLRDIEILKLQHGDNYDQWP